MPSSIDNINAASAQQKINRGDKTFTVTGQEVK